MLKLDEVSQDDGEGTTTRTGTPTRNTPKLNRPRLFGTGYDLPAPHRFKEILAGHHFKVQKRGKHPFHPILRAKLPKIASGTSAGRCVLETCRCPSVASNGLKHSAAFQKWKTGRVLLMISTTLSLRLDSSPISCITLLHCRRCRPYFVETFLYTATLGHAGSEIFPKLSDAKS